MGFVSKIAEKTMMLHIILFFMTVFVYAYADTAVPVSAAAFVTGAQIVDTAMPEQESEEPSDTASDITLKKVLVQNPDFDMSVNCGLNGYAVYDSPVMVDITVTCAHDFTGSIRLIPNMDEDDYYMMTKVAYERDLTLAKGEAKTFTFYPSSIGNSGKIKIAVMDETGAQVYAETDQAELAYQGENVIVGILSDDYPALNYMDGIAISSGSFVSTAKLLELPVSGIPEKWEALGMVSYLVIDNFDTAKLSEGQYDAIKKWVENGGVLILGLGGNYQNVLHIFSDDFISGTVGELTKETVTWEVPASLASRKDAVRQAEETGDFTGASIGRHTDEDPVEEVSLDHVDVLKFEMKDGKELSGFSAGGTALKKETGRGAVVVLSYGLSMDPVAGFSKNAEMATALLEASAMDDTMDSGLFLNTDRYSYDASNVADINDTTKRPSVTILAVILGLYIVLAGPVLYLVLKKINKREKIWLAVPVSAGVFTLVLFGFTYMYQVGNPIVNTFSVLELEKNVQKENVYASVICPAASEYELRLEGDYTNLRYDYYNNGGGNYFAVSGPAGNDRREYDLVFRETNEGTKLVLDNDRVFHKTSFYLNRQTPNEAGLLDLDIHCYTDGFEGTITNNTIFDLEHALVYFENYYYRIEELKRGEQAAFTREDVQTMLPNNANFYAAYSDYDNKEDYLKARIDSVMADVYLSRDAYSGGIWAVASGYQAKICSEEDSDQNGCGIICQEFTKEYEDMGKIYYEDISGRIEDTVGDYDKSDLMMNDEIVEMTYRFEKGDRITRLINKNFLKEDADVSDIYSPFYYGDVYAYNVKIGEFDQIFTDSAVLDGRELKKYLDGETLILRFQTDRVYEAYIPVIAAAGD